MSAVQTVLGPVAVTSLGTVLPHEHLFINQLKERRADGLINDEALVRAELTLFKEAGGGAVFDLTSAELTAGSTPDSRSASSPWTRDPANVRAAARVAYETGVHVVLGTGHYRDPYLDRSRFDWTSADEICEELVRDLQEGFTGATSRAGIIGEVGADKWYLSAAEERSFRASARASRLTGAPIYTHAARWPVGLTQLDVLGQEGVAPERVAVGHCDTVPLQGYAVAIARRGAYVGVDTINCSNPTIVSNAVGLVLELVRAGHIDRILLSQDVCTSSHLQAFGGGGFTFVQSGFKQALAVAGLQDGEFAHMTIANPARLLTG